MKMSRIVLAFALTQMCSLSSNGAGEKTFHWVMNSKGFPGVEFAIGYTLGTHLGAVNTLGEGEMILDAKEQTIQKALFKIPIKFLTTQDAKRDCHLREALGIDYEKSEYPKDHVCGENNTLPDTGKNAVSFPEITFQLSEPAIAVTETGKDPRFALNGNLSLHGITQPIKGVVLNWVSEGEHRILKGEFKIKLADYKVVVKKFGFISVSDDATIELNMPLKNRPKS